MLIDFLLFKLSKIQFYVSRTAFCNLFTDSSGKSRSLLKNENNEWELLYSQAQRERVLTVYPAVRSLGIGRWKISLVWFVS